MNVKDQIAGDLAVKLIDMVQEVSTRWRDIAHTVLSNRECDAIMTMTFVQIAASFAADVEATPQRLGARFSDLITIERQVQKRKKPIKRRIRK